MLEALTENANRDTQQAQEEVGESPHTGKPGSALLRSSNSLPVHLNDRWRVTYDPLQWILEHRSRHPTARDNGFRGRSFCTTRDNLLECILEHCGEVDPSAMEIIRALPPRHTDTRQ